METVGVLAVPRRSPESWVAVPRRSPESWVAVPAVSCRDVLPVC